MRHCTTKNRFLLYVGTVYLLVPCAVAVSSWWMFSVRHKFADSFLCVSARLVVLWVSCFSVRWAILCRYAVAKKLARAQAGSAGDGEERGMQRAAAAAGLEWDDDAMQRWVRTTGPQASPYARCRVFFPAGPTYLRSCMSDLRCLGVINVIISSLLIQNPVFVR